MDGTLTLVLEGEELILHPQRAVLWPGRKTVIVADTHFGKSSYFSSHGLAVPAGTDEEDLFRLARLVRESRADRLIVLGDFLHAPISTDSREALLLAEWAHALAPARVVVIAGNHDRGATDLGTSSISWHQGAWLEVPFSFVHHATRIANSSRRLFTLSGHIHPVTRLRSATNRGVRVPVFWQRADGLVLPSFGQFTGGFAVRAAKSELLYAAGFGVVARIG